MNVAEFLANFVIDLPNSITSAIPIYWTITILSQAHTADFYRCDLRFLSLV